MEQPLVSVLIVTWNRSRELQRSIESALAQSYQPLEVLVVDNASTDNTYSLVRAKFPQVRILRVHRNLGCPSGRNLGFPNCRGKYIYLLDDDGWLDPNAVQLATERAESDPSLAVVMSRVHEIDGDRVVAKLPAGADGPAYLGSFIGCCALLRRDALEQVGYFPDDFFRQGEEADLSLRLLDSGQKIMFEPKSIMYHKPSPINRDVAQFYFYELRNSTKTALRLWPWPWAIPRFALNWLRSCHFALTHGRVSWPFVLAADAVWTALQNGQGRRPVRIETLRLQRRLLRNPSPESPKSGTSVSAPH